MMIYFKDIFKSFCVPLCLLMVLSCTEKTEEEFSLMGEIKGKIYSYDEFGGNLEERGQAQVVLEGDGPLFTTMTDAEGHFNFSNVPTGTYNILLSKDGFGARPVYGLKIIGGDEPLYTDSYIMKISTSRLDDITTSWAGNTLTVNAKIEHHYPYVYYYDVRIVTFLNKGSVVSSENYMVHDSHHLDVPSGTYVDFYIFCDPELFPSGSTVSFKAYGRANYDYGYSEAGSMKVNYSTLSESPSETITILVP